jgi:hypothetical protein
MLKSTYTATNITLSRFILCLISNLGSQKLNCALSIALAVKPAEQMWLNYSEWCKTAKRGAMYCMSSRWLGFLAIAMGSISAVFSDSAIAQIIPDGTLPNNSIDGALKRYYVPIFFDKY